MGCGGVGGRRQARRHVGGGAGERRKKSATSGVAEVNRRCLKGGVGSKNKVKGADHAPKNMSVHLSVRTDKIQHIGETEKTCLLLLFSPASSAR